MGRQDKPSQLKFYINRKNLNESKNEIQKLKTAARDYKKDKKESQDAREDYKKDGENY